VPTVRPMNTVQHLGSRDCGKRDLVVEIRQDLGEEKFSAFGGNEDAGVNQDRHGDLGMRGCLRIAPSTARQ